MFSTVSDKAACFPNPLPRFCGQTFAERSDSRYRAKYRATREQMATFIVNNRLNAALSPDAVFFGKPITVDY